MTRDIDGIRSWLQRFQDGYTARDLSAVDEFMKLLDTDEGIELIGIGASKRAAHEWFEGPTRIREIIPGDWQC